MDQHFERRVDTNTWISQFPMTEDICKVVQWQGVISTRIRISQRLGRAMSVSFLKFGLLSFGERKVCKVLRAHMSVNSTPENFVFLILCVRDARIILLPFLLSSTFAF